MSRLGWLAGIVAGALLMVGCTGGEPTAKSPPSTPAAPATTPVTSSSPTPTVAPPALPAAAREKTRDGAVAFVVHFIDAVNYLRLSGDAPVLTRLSAGGCESCSAIVKTAEEIYRRGGYMRGGGWSVERTTSLRTSPRPTWQVVVEIRVARQLYKASSGAAPERRRAEEATLIFDVIRSRGGWLVDSLERQG